MMPGVIHCIEIGCYISTHPSPNLGWRERLCRLVLPFHLYIFCSPWSSFKLVYFLLPFRGKRSSMGWEGVPKWPPEHYTCWWRSNEPGCVAEHQQRLGQTTWTLQLLKSIFSWSSPPFQLSHSTVPGEGMMGLVLRPSLSGNFGYLRSRTVDRRPSLFLLGSNVCEKLKERVDQATDSCVFIRKWH